VKRNAFAEGVAAVSAVWPSGVPVMFPGFATRLE
jgi:hypothetical protein